MVDLPEPETPMTTTTDGRAAAVFGRAARAAGAMVASDMVMRGQPRGR